MTDKKDAISCAHLNWIFDLCRSRSIHLQRITGECSYSLEHLTDQTQTIPWHIFLDLVSQAGKFFDEDDLREIGRNSWLSPQLQVQASIGQIMFKPSDQFLSIYGASGYCVRQFPIDATAKRLSDRQIDIRLAAGAGAQVSEAFFTIIAGQMESLTTNLGLSRSKVMMTFQDRVAHYSVTMPESTTPASMFRRLNRWLRASKILTREFAGIQERLEKLTDSYQRSSSDRESRLEGLEQKLGFYEVIAEQDPDISWTMTPTGDARFINPITNLLGYQEDEATLQDIVSPAELAALTELVNLVIQSHAPTSERLNAGNTPSIILETRHKLGHNIRLGVQIIPGHQRIQSAEKGAFAICIGKDVTDIHEMTDRLKEQKERLDVISELSPDAIFTLGQGKQIIDANPAAHAIFGYQHRELIGLNLNDLLPSSLAAAQQGIKKDRSTVPVQIVTSPESLQQTNNGICVVRDMTSSAQFQKEQKSLERQLHSLQKMDSVGQLASGIAHDFNNLLVAILGLTDLARESVTSKELADRLDEIRATGSHGKDLTQRLLNFGRQQETSHRLIEANETIRDCMALIARLIPESITVKAEIHEHPVFLLADHSQLEQVLVNLAVNARDAMPDGGLLRVSTRINPEKRGPGTRDAEQFVLEVTDNGTGMDQDTQQRIFEPLYTTKPEGHGTGLGLSVISRIVDRHQGTISVHSERGVGSTFQVSLPTLSPARKALAAGSPAAVHQSLETILLVENNPKDRELARLILAGAGYNILEAPDCVTAVSTYLDNHPLIDLILVDTGVPDIDEIFAGGAIPDLFPAPNIVLTNGYPAGSEYAGSVSNTGSPIIQKPFGVDELRSRVRAALDNDSDQAEETG